MSDAGPGPVQAAVRFAVDRLLAAVNPLLRLLAGRRRPPRPTAGEEGDLAALAAREAGRRSDMSDHLVRLYSEAAALEPSLIVELGTRAGESTRALARAAARSGAALVSVDLEPTEAEVTYEGWHFVRDDDLAFAETFPDWCRRRGLEPAVDFLLLDTSHEREHTRAEIEAWFPHLADRCRAAFHDTNLRWIYRRRDGTLGRAWNNRRGVVACLEELLDLRIDERVPFTALRGEWLVRHDPKCCGLTVLERTGDETTNGGEETK